MPEPSLAQVSCAPATPQATEPAAADTSTDTLAGTSVNSTPDTTAAVSGDDVSREETLIIAPKHPYTEALLSAVLHPDPTRRNVTRIHLEGSVADPANPPSGCAFHPRYRYAQERCQQEVPMLRQTSTGQLVACHFAEALDLAGVG